RKLAAHDFDFLLLLDDDRLSKPTQNGIAPELQLSLGHIDRTLVMRNHHGSKVSIGVAAMSDRHSLAHAIHRVSHHLAERSLRLVVTAVAFPSTFASLVQSGPEPPTSYFCLFSSVATATGCNH